MTVPHGIHSMVDPLRHVMVRPPDRAFGAAFDDPSHGFLRPVDLELAAKEHERFCELLAGLGATVHELAGPSASPDTVFTYDASLVTGRGAITLRSGKRSRREEGALHEAWYAAADIPVVGRIEAPGTVDGGDVLWLAEDLVAIGRSLRTNQDGIDQLIRLLDEDCRVFDVPYHRGPEACLHLMSAVSLVADRLAVVEAALVPSGLYDLLRSRDVELIEIPSEESAGLGSNVLAVEPGVVVVVDGSPRTRRRLERRGVEVHAYDGAEISINGTGGPTCLTRPVQRA